MNEIYRGHFFDIQNDCYNLLVKKNSSFLQAILFRIALTFFIYQTQMQFDETDHRTS